MELYENNILLICRENYQVARIVFINHIISLHFKEYKYQLYQKCKKDTIILFNVCTNDSFTVLFLY